ncbi:hypothetical protein FRACA_2250009 [Frankia canadensis]|uniref:AAA+ ATPase domain-containing protein n=1 Tax=Frankia canadensis TaxID=1836972 RepID=A0A2I2KR72_9ACTN|nr:hypothetical protein FRACA_2250009 [Frankia canadensis]SOU55458.1 hypothetical protein FRACA_2250009 [Frankia canadensis]
MLRLPSIRAQFTDLAEAAARDQMTYRGFLAELLMAECDDRNRRRSERRIKAAAFPRDKTLRTFDFLANNNVDPAVVHTLAKCDWVKKGLPLCLIGDSGTGKSHLLIALGTEAAMVGHRVRYVLATKLVEAADEKMLAKTIARYGRVDLLCIDELGIYGTRPARRRAALPGVDRARGKGLRCDRVQRGFFGLDEDLHRPATLRRDRRPAHLRRQHHRDRHRLLPSRPNSRPHRQDHPDPGLTTRRLRCCGEPDGSGRTRRRSATDDPRHLRRLLRPRRPSRSPRTRHRPPRPPHQRRPGLADRHARAHPAPPANRQKRP